MACHRITGHGLIHAPALVRALRLRDGPSMQAHVLATTHAHAYLKAFQPIPAMDALLVHKPALTTERRSITWIRRYPKRGRACAISRMRKRSAD
jgi:hypothetical protein